MDQMPRVNHYSAWQLIKLYWHSEKRTYIYIVSSIIIFMTLVLVALDVVFSYWFNFFYDALQEYKLREAVILLVIFFALAGFNIILAVYRYYISQVFGLRWRRWLTGQFIDRWLANRDYYYLETFDEHTDNPDQRIQEDINSLVTNSISLAIGMVAAVTTFIAFIYVLWRLSGQLHIHLGSWGVWNIPGYLVWVAVIYSSIGTYLTFKIGRPLIGLNFEQQRREATFRFAAIDLRSHAENVALYRGETHQKNILQQLFGGVLENWYAIILRQKLLLWFTSGYNQVAVALPLLVVLPNYFEKVFLLGGLMQSLRAFSSIQDALSFLVNAYPQIAEWRAVTQRLTTLLDHMNAIDQKVMQQDKLAFHKEAENKIVAKNVSISTPQGDALLKGINAEFIHKQNYLLQGVSGIGKSTFIRTIAGIWPYAAGDIVLPTQQKIMYLPQNVYMPIGTLAEAILFPDKQHPELKAQLPQVLRDCLLENLIPRLDETAAWSDQLSPGEQQRVAFARVLIHKPDWVFLDETTSMLDVASEKHMYKLLKAQLPNCSIISVSHRPTLDTFHDHVINVTQYSAGIQQPASA